MTKRLLNVEQFAEIMNIAKKTAYNYLEGGRFQTAFKLGREWRIDEVDLWEIEIPRLKQNGVFRKTR